MQCPNCGFENIPGLPSCARCRSGLGLGDVVVVPRRASALRVTTRVLRVWYAVGFDLSLFWRWLRQPRSLTVAGAPAGSLACTLLLPGLGHIMARHKTFGRVVLVVWLVALLAALATLASPWSARCLLVAVFMHTLALMSLLAGPEGLSPARRTLLGLAVFFGLQWLWYLPWLLLVRGVIVPLPLTNMWYCQILQSGDGILHEGSWLCPDTFQRGELVVYDIPPLQSGHVYVAAGLGLDRVLGLPSEHVQWDGDRLTVNGAELDPDTVALASLRYLREFDVRLTDHEYLIPPSRLRLNLSGGGVDFEALFWRLLVVPSERIRGRVFWRTWPWQRWGPVE